ncbi:response regulator [Brevibacillus laterosporus GI-9]|uniref:response regulator transcription factor n=1 Tax=Brevibacillus TaxID=55080 RepID=UPI0002404AAF|nr:MULTISPECIES: response regulator transcription factor [Brevibacillus]MCR8963267.1 response regulator transcription factor [Brevibacillus laterosporus]MCZ0835422.1 response regulator transcription factor [Brevibacillus halotolerans]CCF13148.1 response regulator [Brevibacillus laterosporus GI-9]
MLHAQLLVVDDELAIGKMLRTVLSKEGFEHVDVAISAEDALNACQNKTYDLILLDVMLPGKSGVEICPLLRVYTNAPILFVTAKNTDLDKLSGFAVGADDYITKPFHPLEVVARIKAHLRRYLQSTEREPLAVNPTTVYDFGHFLLDEQAGEVRVANKVVDFPAQVYQLLLFLCQNPNRIFSKQQLYEHVWGHNSFSDDNTVMVHIHRIRERIEPIPSNPIYLVTIRGLGYKLLQRGAKPV